MILHQELPPLILNYGIHAPGVANSPLSILMVMVGGSRGALLAQPAPSGVGPGGGVCQGDGSPL